MLYRFALLLICAAICSCGKSDPGSPLAEAGGVAPVFEPGGATPEEAFANFIAAGKRKDWRGFILCVDVDSRDGMLLTMTQLAAITTMDDKDAQKVFRDLCVKHGVPEENAGATALFADPEKAMAAAKVRFGGVKDKAAFFVEMMEFNDRYMDGRSTPPMSGATLKDLTVSGDTAKAVGVDEDGMSLPVGFRKRDGRWFVVFLP